MLYEELARQAWLAEFGDNSHVSLYVYTLAYNAGLKRAKEIIDFAMYRCDPEHDRAVERFKKEAVAEIEAEIGEKV